MILVNVTPSYMEGIADDDDGGDDEVNNSPHGIHSRATAHQIDRSALAGR